MHRYHELKILIKYNKLLPQLEEQMHRLGKIIERDAPPNCYNLDSYTIQLKQYSYLCRKVRQLRRIHEKIMARNPKGYQ